jgi:hypothetical protein
VLWHKAWLDTRWRFVLGLAVLLLVAAGGVLAYGNFQAMPPEMFVPGYRDYVWTFWIRGTLRQLWALFAVVIGAGGLLSQARRGGGLFMLALPVTRGSLLWTRASVGLAEIAALTIGPTLAIVLLSPLVGQTFSVSDALVFGVCAFVGVSTMFAATTLLSTMLPEAWGPPLIVLCAVTLLGFARDLAGLPMSVSLLAVTTGESYFRDGQVPVAGLIAAAVLTAAMLHIARVSLTRRDF